MRRHATGELPADLGASQLITVELASHLELLQALERELAVHLDDGDATPGKDWNDRWDIAGSQRQALVGEAQHLCNRLPSPDNDAAFARRSFYPAYLQVKALLPRLAEATVVFANCLEVARVAVEDDEVTLCFDTATEAKRVAMSALIQLRDAPTCRPDQLREPYRSQHLKPFMDEIDGLAVAARKVAAVRSKYEEIGNENRRLRERLRAAIVPGETEILAAEAIHGVYAEETAVVCQFELTDQRLLWALPGGGEVMALRLDEVVGLGENSQEWLQITYGGDRGGGASVEFFFEYDEKDALMQALRRSAPFFDEWRQTADSYKQLDGVPVTTWPACPICGHVLSERTEHTAHCGDRECSLYFGDPGFEPKISTEAGDYGHLRGESAWMPLLLSEAAFRGHTLVWIVAPIDAPVMKKMFYRYELVNWLLANETADTEAS
jgi:hypothetical protein